MIGFKVMRGLALALSIKVHRWSVMILDVGVTVLSGYVSLRLQIHSINKTIVVWGRSRHRNHYDLWKSRVESRI